MNYAEMSDLQVNIAVASKLAVNAKVEDGALFTSKIHDGENVISVTTVTDFCNNPSDTWPIIVENGVCITSPAVDGERWRAMIYTSNKNYSWSDKNPLRAAMIVFLMMNEDK